MELFAGDRIETEEDVLSFREVGAVEFTDAAEDFEFGQVENVGDGHAGLHLIAFADIGHVEAKTHAARLVLPHGDEAAHRGEDFDLR